MATYTHHEVVASPVTPWYALVIGDENPVSATDTLLVLLNSDGTETRIHGSDFTYDFAGNPTGGTISSIERTDAGGATVYETVTGLSLSLVALVGTSDNRDAFRLIFANADTFNGWSGDDFFVGGPGADNFNGGSGGTDTVSYDNATAAVTANLTNVAGTGDAAGDTYTSIENLIGSDFNDILIGNSGINALTGGLGNDTLNGGGAGDILDGGAGSDTASYQNATAGLTADLATSTNNTGEAAGDSYISIENLRGSAFGDTLRGDAANNSLNGGGGADVLDGGDGSDTASYQNAAAGLTADLATLANNSGEAAGDSYISIENLRGSAFSDTLRGDAANNLLNGGEGADVLDGGAGFDTAGYQNATAGLTVDLGNTANNTGEAVGDSYFSIENLRGSDFNDTLRGDTGNNLLNGGGGADVLDGGAGFDTASYQNATAGVTVDLSNSANNTGEATGDTFISIEGLRGSAFNDTLIGDALLNGGTALNQFDGGLGADTLIGNGGVGNYAVYRNSTAGVTVSLTNSAINTGEAAGDTYTGINSIVGSAFNDTLIGNADNNWLVGGAGADALDGQGSGDRDAAAYWNATSGLTASLATPGINTGDAAGDTYTGIEGLVGSQFNDVLIGDDNDNFLVGTGGADELHGGLGSDTASYTIFTADVGITADLANSAANTGEAAGDTYDSIENLTGTNFDDSLYGDANANILRGSRDGGAGNDSLDGRAGADTLVGGLGDDILTGGADNDAINGGADSDTAVYSGNRADYLITLNLDGSYSVTDTRPGSPDGSDTVLDVEFFQFADQTVPVEDIINEAPTITSDGGGASASVSVAENGVAVTTVTATDPDAGQQLTYAIVGGNDMLLFDINSLTGELVFISPPDFEDPGDSDNNNVYDVTVEVTDGELTDTQSIAITVENVLGVTQTGSNQAQTLTGTGEDDILFGLGGNDTLIGLGGPDVLNGGAGTDTASYAGSLTGVSVSLSAGSATGGDAEGDTFIGIENLTGSSHNDTLEGDAANNVLVGGNGIDTVSYAHAAAGVTVSLATSSTQNTGGAGRDTLSSFENLTGSEFNDVLTGSSAANVLTGLGGSDRFVIGGFGDVVTDFADNDLIDLSAIDANTLVKKDQAFGFAGQNASVVANSVTWSEVGGDTVVRADVNGDTTADLTFVLIGVNHNLTSSDFLL
jgi:Ca2+-binding RTX toxin-like protein